MTDKERKYMYSLTDLKQKEIADSLRIAPTEEELEDIFTDCARLVGVDWKEFKDKDE